MPSFTYLGYVVRLWWAQRPIFNVTRRQEAEIQWSKLRLIGLELIERGEEPDEWKALIEKYDELLGRQRKR